MLSSMLGNGAQVILIENASRFARDLVVQLTGHDLLKAQGITLLPVDAPDYFTDETPTAVMVRQILGAVSQFEKTSLVQKLRQARERKRLAAGRSKGPRQAPVPEKPQDRKAAVAADNLSSPHGTRFSRPVRPPLRRGERKAHVGGIG